MNDLGLSRNVTCGHSNPSYLDKAWLLFSIGLLMRVIVLAAVLRFTDVTFQQYVHKGDGESYVLIADAMLGRVDLQSIDPYHHRVFLGYPALMAILGATGIPVGAAGLAITMLSAALVPVLVGRFFDNARLAWASLVMVPHWVINSSLVMTEAPTLAASLLGLVLAKSGRWVWAGVALGTAGLIRPMACVAVLGVLCALMIQRRIRPALLLAAITLAVFVAGTAAGSIWKGSLLDNARIYRDNPRAYGGELFAVPFTSLIRETFSTNRSIGFSIYIWIHVAFVLVGIAMLARQSRRDRSLPTITALGWAIGNTLFVLCIGSHWGYQHFPRFGILSQPAVLAGWTRWLPSNRWIWFGLCAATTAFTIYGVWTTP